MRIHVYYGGLIEVRLGFAGFGVAGIAEIERQRVDSRNGVSTIGEGKAAVGRDGRRPRPD